MFNMTIQPRFAETDALGHINNTHLPVWFEQARTPLFRIFVPDLDPAGWNLILAKVETEFLRELLYQHPVNIKTGVETIGNSSFVVYQEVWQNEKKAAIGRATLVHFDHKNKSSMPIPDTIRQGLVEHLFSPDAGKTA